jgi:hypothetical protein
MSLPPFCKKAACIRARPLSVPLAAPLQGDGERIWGGHTSGCKRETGTVAGMPDVGHAAGIPAAWHTALPGDLQTA